ncbi:MAG: molybdopterin-dependent oxidoreductase [Planctomycetales bacterium]|nr:molybdopterin-dependent oxidoreductase [Planctomycetales bacterium]
MPNRRRFIRSTGLAATAVACSPLPVQATGQTDSLQPTELASKPLLTPAGAFRDVSRGNPKPHTLMGKALEDAGLTPNTWRLEILADPFTDELVREAARVEKDYRLESGTALDLPALMKIAVHHGVGYLKAVQCLNIQEPLGQGLWEGVPLRNVIGQCGRLRNVRRIYFYGFHNHDPDQRFQSSLSYSQAMETAPGDPPVFLAYRLNGEPIPLERGGPVRMIVPWGYGFKSIKWLQCIQLTNDFRANDTYARQNNDPDSPMKSAAYLDKLPAQVKVGQHAFLSGQVISGFSGVERVEYWLHRVEQGAAPVEYDGPVYRSATWIPCKIESEPSDWESVLPKGIDPLKLAGFDAVTGRAKSWPLRYGMANWYVRLPKLAAGTYEFRVRTVDLNGFAQPEPRAMLKAGKNAVEVHRFEVL